MQISHSSNEGAGKVRQEKEASEGYVKVVQAQDAIKRRLTPGFHEG